MTSRLHPASFEEVRWPRVVGRPHPGLRASVLHGYLGLTEATLQRRLVITGSTAVRVVIMLEESTAHRSRPPEFALGPQSRSFVPEGACAPSYVELCLTPLGAFRIFGAPLRSLVGGPVDLVEALGPGVKRLGERLRDEHSWRRRFSLLDRFLLGRLNSGPPPAPEVRRAWELLSASRGALPIREIVSEVGWSHRHLIAKFKQQVGLTPKIAGQLIRFETARRALRDAAPGQLGNVAAAGGYADQAHLVRDFRRFSGTTPTDYLAQISPGLAGPSIAEGP